MKIAIFDGIQETHLSLSLERALCSLGHEVLNTQKINHGFLFEKNSEKLELIEGVLQQIIDFRADWILVFRPASLPIHLLKRIKDSGIRLAVWLSDDPVLYDLIYGPVLSAYDLVLHCGNEKVLDFYETEFGRPTGVNFPFWTDSVAFPYVFGSREAYWNIMFLGNVHDQVRRNRYFELAEFKEDIKHFGNSGTDFLGISGGFLDTDDEVVAAASHSKAAMSIPQYFKDHKGMVTWFPGLDKLGSFEYPSRIIQYMAMGLPVFNVTAGAPNFEAFPEMMVFDSVRKAVNESKDLLANDAQLKELSLATHARFEHSFSALCRARFLIELFNDNSWEDLNSKQRANLFTEYGSGVSSIDIPNLEDGLNNETSDEDAKSIVVPGIEKQSPEARSGQLGESRWLVFGLGWTDNHSAVNTAVRALRGQAANVVELNPASCKNSLQKRGDQLGYSIDVTKLNVKFSPDDVLLVCGIDAVLTEQGKSILEDAGVHTIFFDPKPSNDLKRIGLLVNRFGFVYSPNSSTVALYSAAGVKNIGYYCSLLEDEYLSFVPGPSDENRMLRVRRSKGQEEFFARCFEYDLSLEPIEYKALEQETREGLAQELRTKVTFLTLAGKKGFPILPPWFGLALAQSECLVTQRVGSDLFPAELRGSLIEVQNYGEIESKVNLLIEDKARMQALSDNRKKFLKENCSASSLLLRALDILSTETPHEQQIDPLDSKARSVSHGSGISLPEPSNPGSSWDAFEVSVDSTFSTGSQEVGVECEGKLVGTFLVKPGKPTRIALRWKKPSDREKFHLKFRDSVCDNEQLSVRHTDVKHTFVSFADSPSVWVLP